MRYINLRTSPTKFRKSSTRKQHRQENSRCDSVKAVYATCACAILNWTVDWQLRWKVGQSGRGDGYTVWENIIRGPVLQQDSEGILSMARTFFIRISTFFPVPWRMRQCHTKSRCRIAGELLPCTAQDLMQFCEPLCMGKSSLYQRPSTSRKYPTGWLLKRPVLLRQCPTFQC